jgi:hypothetical protein
MNKSNLVWKKEGNWLDITVKVLITNNLLVFYYHV